MDESGITKVGALSFEKFAERIRLGISRRQVVFGGDKLLRLAKRRDIGLVWATSDLSKHALGKLKLTCRKFDVPLLISGTSTANGEFTGEPTVKIYIIKKSFSGISQVMREVQAEIE